MTESKYLPLHPEPYLFLRPLPEIDGIFLVRNRHHHAEEIIDSRVLKREIERKHDDQRRARKCLRRM